LSKFDVFIGSFWSGRYRVRSMGNGSVYYLADGGGRETVRCKITPSAKAWVAFWKACSDIDMENWNKKYEADDFVSDGDEWSFSIETPALSYKGEGHNAFPDNFDVFRASVRKLLGGLAF
jgi:hypothetical protein